MKKQVSLFVLAATVLGLSPVMAAGTNSGMRGASSADLTGAPGVRTKANVNYEKYETRTTTRTYSAKDAKDIYYTQPAKRGELYKSAGTSSAAGTVRTTRAETARREVKRKYYLAHPFFQPLQGKIGSVTDLSYAMNSFDFDVDDTFIALSDTKANWDMSQFSIKQDLSYGITDEITILGMARYASSKYQMDWANSGISDKMNDSGIDIWGLGAQWRFVDTPEWIALFSGYYQNQVDVANTFLADLKVGYKTGMSTIYGVARGWLVSLDGNYAGAGITDDAGASMMLAYIADTSNVTYVEGGLGLFSVLEEDWTLNLEAVLGNYDWHNQASFKAAIGWQPEDSFALNLYVKTALYDSANGKSVPFIGRDPNNTTPALRDWNQIGTAKIDGYSETSVGLQAIFLF